MSIKTRRIICIIFILIFFIATPLIIAYATGYKLSFNKKFLQKTGIFILDSHPSGAKIFINNKIQQNLFKKIFLNKQTYITTPAKIKNLSPGEYVVRLELTDYWPWGKKLSIKPGLATYAEDIYLFKQNLPVLAISTKINDLKLSPAKNKLAILNSNQLILFNLINETKQITPLLNKKKSLSWSNNNQKIILDNTAYDVDNLDNKITIDDLAIKNPTKLSWTDNKLYYTSVDSLSYFDPMNKSSEEIINKKEINDYVIKN
ncbi:hypothetical protein KKH16_02170, partial [Patescibacteria group bacterium]|nr:hypothetical protein [Patescibacteria group bacterium]